ncbi:MAG TPA: tetratricopeptide repeat protein, partial [Polyangia bacterium]|nr:tetratricopeptide repeat protein [Polyangia bacterium]
TLHYDFFALGQIHKEGGQYRVRVALHAAASGHEVAHQEAVGGDVCALVDELSLKLRRELGIPAPHIESAPDLPVCDIVTHSMPALAETMAADHAMFDDDPGAALAHFEKAVQIDPTYADAEVTLFYFYFQSHEPDKMRKAMEATVANLYKLAEPQRFDFTAMRYLLEGNFEKAGAVLTNWVTLYPQSAEAKQKLAEHYRRRDDRAQAVALFEQALDLDPTSLPLTNELVDLHMEHGEVEAAVAVYRRFLAQFPNDADTHVALADNLVAAARFAEAKQSYERALAIDDDNIHATLGLLSIRFLQGDRDSSLLALKKLLDETKLPRDRRAVFDALIDSYWSRGQVKLALQTFLDERRELDRTSLPLNNDRARLEEARLFVLAGKRAEIEQLMARETGSSTMKENVNLQLSMELAQLEVADQLDDAKAMTAQLPALTATLREFGLEHFRQWQLPYEARIKELAHDWAGAKTTWLELERRDWSNWKAAVGVGRCQRQLGDLAAAHAQLTKAAARFVGQGEVYYELAQADRTRDVTAARAALATALAIWAPADADFKPAQDARALAATLGATAKTAAK